MRRSKAEKSSRQKRPSSSLSPEAVADLQLQKDEVVVDMMEMKEKDELVMEEVPEGQLVVAEPELHETNNKGGVEPHHQPSGIYHKCIYCVPFPKFRKLEVNFTLKK